MGSWSLVREFWDPTRSRRKVPFPYQSILLALWLLAWYGGTQLEDNQRGGLFPAWVHCPELRAQGTRLLGPLLCIWPPHYGSFVLWWHCGSAGLMPREQAVGWPGSPCFSHCRGPLFRGILSHGVIVSPQGQHAQDSSLTCITTSSWYHRCRQTSKAEICPQQLMGKHQWLPFSLPFTDFISTLRGLDMNVIF